MNEKAIAIPAEEPIDNHIYSYFDRPKFSGLDTGDKTEVQQQFKELCDANAIAARCGFNPRSMADVRVEYGDELNDLTTVPSDITNALELSQRFNRVWNTFPAAIRAEFGNSPIALGKFMSDPKNHDRCVELGIFKAPIVEPEPKNPEPEA